MSDYIPLNEYGIIKVQGRDAFTFLQGQLTCDLRMVTAENPVMGAYCNQKGRVRALMRIFLRNSDCDEPEYFLVLPVGLVGGVKKTLEQFGMFSEVKFQDVTSEFEVLGVFGEDFDKKISLDTERSLDADLSLSNKLHIDTEMSLDSDLPLSNKFLIDTEMSLDSEMSVDALKLSLDAKRYLHSIPDLDPSKILVFMLPGIVQRCMVILPKELADIFYKSANKKNCASKWLQMDIESGMPEIWPETTEHFLPHHLNMPKLGFINFKKGCFSGQEIIARMEYRTEIKRHLYLAKGISYIPDVVVTNIPDPVAMDIPDAVVTDIPDAVLTDIPDIVVKHIPDGAAMDISDVFVPKPGMKIRAENVSPGIDIGTVVSASRVENGNEGCGGIVALVELKEEFRESGLYIISDNGLRWNLSLEKCGTFQLEKA